MCKKERKNVCVCFQGLTNATSSTRLRAHVRIRSTPARLESDYFPPCRVNRCTRVSPNSTSEAPPTPENIGENSALRVSEGRTTLRRKGFRRGREGVVVKRRSAQHCWDKGKGENRRWVEQAEVEIAGGGGSRESRCSLPAMTRVSISEVSRVPRCWNSSAGRTREKHPPWESAFFFFLLLLPSDAEWWIGPASAHTMHLWRERERDREEKEEEEWGGSEGVARSVRKTLPLYS